MAQTRKLAVIIFTDIVGYTAMMGNDEDEALRITQANHKLQKGLVEQYNGHFIKELGDGMLAYFESPQDALRCGIEIQKEVKEGDKVDLRIGMHWAEIITEDGDIYGDGVNIASRIEALADPGGIYISNTVQEVISDYSEFETRHLGPAKLKNVEKSQEIFAVQGNGLPEPSMKRFRELANPKKKFPVIPTIVTFLILVVLTIFLVNYFQNRADIIQAEASLVEIEELVNSNWRDFTEAYNMAKKVEGIIPENERLKEFINQTSVYINITTEPSGSEVFMKKYHNPNDEWKSLGVTPLDSIQVPIGIFRWKFEKEGYEPVSAAELTFTFKNPTQLQRSKMYIGSNIDRVMDKDDEIPPGMVRVMGAQRPYGYIEDFFIDKFEVTNSEYLDFVRNGGYENPEYWKQLISDVEKENFDTAIRAFVDQTGKPGPSTWSDQIYPNEQDSFPVTGISWYEANAYAAFVEKSLPTKDHWGLARGENSPIIAWPQLGGTAIFAPHSNYNGDRPVQVGSFPSYTSFGAFDMPGNVREWCWNESPHGRWIRGGAWNDNPYMFASPSQADPMDRTERNGFRCVKYIDEHKIPSEAFMWAQDNILFQKLPLPESPTQEQFEAFKVFYEYDQVDLDAEVALKSENDAGWNLEKVTFNAAYDNEKVSAFIFIPSNAQPPYQTVIYGPGEGVFWQENSEDFEDYYEYASFLRFLVESGRAVVFPIFKGSFERRDEWTAVHYGGSDSYEYVSFITKVIKDYRRSLDYLETRNEFDMTKIAFYGMSYGPFLGSILTAVEPRISINIFYAGGCKSFGRPEVNMANFLPFVNIPTLMINGKYDSIFPFDYDIMNMYDLLGTPEDEKRLALFDSDHLAPYDDMVRESISWLDEHFGQVLYIGDEIRIGMNTSLPNSITYLVQR